MPRSSLLIVGCGDVGLRVLRCLNPNWRVLALTSSPQRLPLLRAAGATPLLGDLDQPASLSRLAGLADRVLILSPPQPQGAQDQRTRHVLAALARRSAPRHIVYASTSGVYGDAGGELVDECRSVAPLTDRARRRVDAERQLRQFGRQHGTCISLLRVPGIYAWNRPGGHPRERLARGTPVLNREDDVFTNHIHADDLARACVLALMRGLPQRAVNVCDDTDMRMGDYFDLAADLCGQARPPRISRLQAQSSLSDVQLSFMSESRRLSNHRLKAELGLRLRYPYVSEGLLAGR
ncbi:MAG: SDR family oxidoreductase [Burkholderiaceae bacterium]|nr:SDR family oxidoreductase [Roseateles sp.]MBV8471600.1 SDR family oxidoreductase [Burkholderiaceae bacterium]